MGRAQGVALLVAVLVQGSAAGYCSPANVTACQQVATTAQQACELLPDTPQKKVTCCMGPANLETCLVNFAVGCTPPVVTAIKTQLDGFRQYLSTTLGFECSQGMGTPTTTVNLLFGASGSDSGPRSGLSSSPSGSMWWQWIIIVLLLCCCLAGAGVGGMTVMGNMKRKRGKKSGRSYDDEATAPLPIDAEQEMPQQSEYQQEMMQAPLVPDAPTEVAAATTNAEAQPLLFGDAPVLLSGPTASTVVTGGYPSSYSYGQVAAPQYTSQYTTGYYQGAQPVAGSYYQAATPTYTYGTQPLAAQQYYTTGATVAPVYATTAYANTVEAPEA